MRAGEAPTLLEGVLEWLSDPTLSVPSLPSPASPLSSRLLLLGRLCLVFSQLATAKLCFDLAGACADMLLVVRLSHTRTHPHPNAAASAATPSPHTPAGVRGP